MEASRRPLTASSSSSSSSFAASSRRCRWQSRLPAEAVDTSFIFHPSSFGARSPPLTSYLRPLLLLVAPSWQLPLSFSPLPLSLPFFISSVFLSYTLSSSHARPPTSDSLSRSDSCSFLPRLLFVSLIFRLHSLRPVLSTRLAAPPPPPASPRTVSPAS